MILSRRAFGLGALASMPVVLGLAAARRDPQIGVQTVSWRDMLGTPGDMVDKDVAATREVGLQTVELFEATILPWELVKATMASPETLAAIYGSPATLTDEHRALREKLRDWRLATPIQYFTDIRRKFAQAGIRVQAFNFVLKDYCTDAEVEWALAATRALGTDVMTASTTLSMAKRCVHAFESHRIRLGLHGHTNVADPNELSSPETFLQGLGLSPLYCVNLDIGHFSAAGFDCIDFMRRHHERIVSIHVKDRKKNNGPDVPLGTGDTPVAAVLRLIRDNNWPIPAIIEYEYKGGPSVPAVKECLAYIRSVLRE